MLVLLASLLLNALHVDHRFWLWLALLPAARTDGGVPTQVPSSLGLVTSGFCRFVWAFHATVAQVVP